MKKQKILSLLFALIMIIPIFQSEVINVNAVDIEGSISTEEIDLTNLPFSDSRILVVLTNEASLKFAGYRISDFSEIECSNVRNLTEETDEILKAQINKQSNRSIHGFGRAKNSG